MAYFMNCKTNYFINLGVNPVVMGCAMCAIVLQVVYIAVTQKGHALWSDALAVLPPVLLIVATITLAGSRIVGIAACLVAAIVGIAASFFDTVKE